MATNFGKLNFSISYKPTSAFPLDSRYYFESKDDAELAAQQAAAAGDTNTIYYYGETVCVVEHGVATLYVIQPDNTLDPVGNNISVDENAFIKDSDNKISLVGFAEATAGAQLVKGSDGKISWVTPSGTTVEGLDTRLSVLENAINDQKDSSGNVTSLGLTSRVTALENKSSFIESVDTDNFTVTDKKLSLNDVPVNKISGLNATSINNIINTDGYSLLSSAQATKLSSIADGADVSLIKQVNTSEFSVDSGVLNLKSVGGDKVNLNSNTDFTDLQSRVGSLEDAVNGNGDNAGLVSTVNNLQTTINNLGDNYIATSVYNAQVGDLSSLLAAMGKESTTIVDEVIELNDRLTWQELTSSTT